MQASASTMEYEDNDSFSTANVIKAGNEVLGYLQKQDKDFYTFTTNEEGHIYVSLDNLPKDFELYLYNSKQQLLSSSKASGKTAEEINLYNQPAGTYYILVDGNYDENNPYSLLAMFPTTTIMQDNVTFEPNNSLENGYPITSGTAYSATISTVVDNDWYKFKTSESGEIRVTLSNLPADYELYLYDSSKKLIASSKASGTSAETITLSDRKQGTYYVFVDGNRHYNDTKAYKLLASYPTEKVKHSEMTLEPNDSLQMGYPVESGKIYSENISDVTDVDVYKFTTTKTGQIRATLFNLPGDYDLYVYNATGTLLASSKKSGTDVETLTLQQKQAGTYYVKVVRGGSYYNNERSYSIKISYPINFVAQSDVDFEPNDSLENSYYLKSGKELFAKISHLTDEDWYTINAKTNTNVSIELTNLPGDYDLSVYNIYGDRLYRSERSGKSSEKIEFNTKNTGTYFIRIIGSNEYNTELYYKLNATYQTAVSVFLDGQLMTLDKAPIISKGTTMLPMRAIFEALGANVEWNQKNQTIIATKDQIKIQLTINNETAYKNNAKMSLAIAPFIQDSSTFVPLRFVSESLGAKVEWNQHSQSVRITTK